MLRKSAIALVLTLSAPLAQAAPITFIFSGVGDLTLDGALHSGTAFTVTFHADTANIQHLSLPGNVDKYEPVSGSLNLGLLGSGAFTDSMYVFNNLNSSVAGFGGGVTATSFGLDFFGIQNAGLASYDLVSAFGPVTDIPYDPQQWTNVATSLGSTSFTNFTSSTFSATVDNVPEPSTIFLVGAGFASLAACRRRKTEVGKRLL